MGGTSFDVCLIEDGKGLVRDEYEIEWDMPIVTPMLDIRSIGAGGGSIAWIDDGGSLRVGPQSAGSTPGRPATGGRHEADRDRRQPAARPARPDAGREVPARRRRRRAARRTVAEPLGLDVARMRRGDHQDLSPRTWRRRSRWSRSTAAVTRATTLLVSFGGAGAHARVGDRPSVGIEKSSSRRSLASPPRSAQR